MRPDAIKNIPFSADKNHGGNLCLRINLLPGSFKVDDFPIPVSHPEVINYLPSCSNTKVKLN